MKKAYSLLAGLVLCALLCACGQETAKAGGDGSAPPMLTAAPAQSGEAPAESPAAAAEESEQMRKAKDMIGKDVAELIAAIGEPISSSYAPSCLGSGEDGEYIYDGFTVYTYKEGETETVRSVE